MVGKMRHCSGPQVSQNPRVCVCAEEVDPDIHGCNCGERSGVFLPLAESGGFSRGLGVIPATATWRNGGPSCYVYIPCLPPGQGNRIAEW